MDEMDNRPVACSMNALDGRREALALRLEEGYRRIDDAVLTGGDVSEWESFWISLLREYEDICREHDLAA